MSMLYEEYSPWKTAHFMDRLSLIKSGKFAPPITLQISLTDKCNNRCMYCYLKDHNKFGDELDIDTVFNTLKDAKSLGIKAVEITGGGDPLVHPYVWEITDEIKRLGLDLGIITNGHNLEPVKLKHATWARISIDSFNPDTYKKIRGAKMFDIDPIRELCSFQNVTVGACSVINKYNFGEIYAFVHKAKEIGFSNVWLKPVEGEGSEIISEKKGVIQKQIKKAKVLMDERFKIFMPDLDSTVQNTEKPFLKCFQQFVATFVASNGDVFPCCSLQVDKKYSVGNIKEKKLSDILKNRKEVRVNKCPLNCFWCEKNKFMNYITTDNPRHVNFM